LISSLEPGSFILEVSSPNNYAIDDHVIFRIKLIQHEIENIPKNSSNGGGQKFFLKENVGNVLSVLKEKKRRKRLYWYLEF
jgi:hypothetical protein